MWMSKWMLFLAIQSRFCPPPHLCQFADMNSAPFSSWLQSYSEDSLIRWYRERRPDLGPSSAEARYYWNHNKSESWRVLTANKIHRETGNPQEVRLFDLHTSILLWNTRNFVLGSRWWKLGRAINPSLRKIVHSLSFWAWGKPSFLDLSR